MNSQAFDNGPDGEVDVQAETICDANGIERTVYKLESGGYFGVRVYQNILTASELDAVEREVGSPQHAPPSASPPAWEQFS